MKILIIGSGGREHALVWKCKQSPLVSQVYCAPGNGGIGEEAELVDIAADDIDGLLRFVMKHEIDLTIVGPEQPLALGIVDRFQAAGRKVWGPVQAAAQLEGSKAFAKAFMQDEGIPTARFATFSQLEPALRFLDQLSAPYVVKADGLAAGKGVIIAATRLEAEQALREILEERRFGNAGSAVVIEEFLEGEEASFIVMCDGEHALPFASSQDHKRLLDGDLGPNTGGMGAYSPAPIVTTELEARVLREVITPVLNGMKARGTPYRGFLYAGLMIDAAGKAKVLEFNCRLGDPETQPLLFRLESDLVAVILTALEGKLDACTLSWTPGYSACVVLAAEGYPDTTKKGSVITGIPAATATTKVFHAGTVKKDGKILTNGGRVLGVTAKAPTLQNALHSAYRIVDQISWPGLQFRRDIGQRGLFLAIPGMQDSIIKGLKTPV